jgi:hypothetical protein
MSTVEQKLTARYQEKLNEIARSLESEREQQGNLLRKLIAERNDALQRVSQSNADRREALFRVQQSESRLLNALQQLERDEATSLAEASLRNALLRRNEELEKSLSGEYARLRPCCKLTRFPDLKSRRSASVGSANDEADQLRRSHEAQSFAFKGLIVQLERKNADLATKLISLQKIASERAATIDLLERRFVASPRSPHSPAPHHSTLTSPRNSSTGSTSSQGARSPRSARPHRASRSPGRSPPRTTRRHASRRIVISPRRSSPAIQVALMCDVLCVL